LATATDYVDLLSHLLMAVRQYGLVLGAWNYSSINDEQLWQQRSFVLPSRSSSSALSSPASIVAFLRGSLDGLAKGLLVNLVPGMAPIEIDGKAVSVLTRMDDVYNPPAVVS